MRKLFYWLRNIIHFSIKSIPFIKENFRKRPILFFGILFLLIGLPIFYLTTIFNKPLEAAWFDDAFSNRKKITITNNSSSQNNVYISITVDTSDTTKFQSDCGDIRFTKYSGTLLPYYVVSGCSTVSTILHIKFDTLLPGNQTILFYYGNPTIRNGFSLTDFPVQASNYSVGSLGSEEKAIGPIGYWRFDEGVGTNAYDSSGNRYNGTFLSSPIWKSESECITGRCLSFDNVDDGVSIANKNFAGLTDYTMSAWINIKGNHKNYTGTIMSSGNWNTSQWVFGINQANTAIDLYSRGSKAYAFQRNTWTHVAVVKNGSTYTFYVNGNNIGSNSGSSSALASDATNTTIGRETYAGGYFAFNGLIDEPKIYAYPRTAAQIKGEYTLGTSRMSGDKEVSAAFGSSGQTNISNSLSGYWKMDELTAGVGVTSFDSSGNNYHGVGAGATGTSVVAGKFGNGKRFNAGTDALTLNSTITLGNGNWTVSSWIKSAANGSILSNNSGGPVSNDLKIETGKIAYANYISSWNNHYGTSTVTDGNWHLLTWVNKSNQTMDMYVDGKLESGNFVSTTNNGGPVNSIGKNWSASFNGTIDEVRYYTRALSPKEVSDLYNFAPGPVAYYSFDEGVGATVYDKSGNNNNGSWNGTLGNQWTNGKYGKAGSFNGSDNYVLLPHLNLDYSFTNCAWVKTNDQNDNPIIGNWQDGGTGDSWLFLANWSGGNKIDWFVRNPTNSGGVNITENNLNLRNNWNYVCGVFNNGQAFIYRNGNLVSSNLSVGFSSVYQNALNLWVGRYSSNYFNGLIDEVKIYNYSRTQKQIIEDMNASHPAGGSPVGSQIAWWGFDEGYGNITHNSGSGGSGYDGTIGTGASSPIWTNNGKFGKAIQFNNANICVNMNNPSGLNMTTNNFSITNHYYGFDTDANVVIEKRGTGLNGYLYVVNYPSAGNVSIFLNDGGSQKVYTFSNASIQANNWYHLVTTINRETNEIKFYKNGTYVQTVNISSTTGSIISDGNFRIGCDLGGGTFNGVIDELKIYNSILTDDEIKVDYNNGQTMQFGTLSSGVGNTASSNAASQEYCVPGDTASCTPPVAEWKFEQGVGSTAYDTSGNGRSGSLISGPRWIQGKNGKSINFDGTDDYIDVSRFYPSASAITFEAWINTTSTDSTKSYSGNAAQNVFGDHTNGVDVGFGLTGGKVNYNVYVSGWQSITGVTSVNDGKWHHIVVTHTGTTVIIYVDGKVDISGTMTYSAGIAVDRIGGGYLNNSGTGDLFMGQIDEPKIYNYARTPAQIAWDYNRGAPVASYDFDECQGTVIHDLSNNRLDGTLIVGAGGTQVTAGTCSTTGTAWGNGSAGKYNSSLNFDGTDDYISVGTPPALSFISSRPNVTFSAWINLKSINIHDGIISNSVDGGGTGQRFTLTEYTGNKLRLILGNNSAYSNYWTTDNSITTGRWIHVVITINSNNELKFYIDGVLNNGVQTLTNDIGTSTANWIIGAAYNNPGYSIDGQIDDVKLFNYSLTAEQVKTLFNNGVINFGPATGSP